MARLATFGETMLRLSPPGNERLETADGLDVHVGGAESNVAVAAQRLGVDATWLSKVPDSALGRRAVSGVRAHGVDPAVVYGEGRQGVYYLERGGPPRGTNVVYDRADAAVTTATADELPVERVREADTFHTTGITPALSGTLAGTTADLLAAAREADTTTSFDLNYRSKLWTPGEARETLSGLLPSVDLLVVAERDAETVLGVSGDPADVAGSLADEYGIRTVVLTRGTAGALAYRDGATHHQPTFEAVSDHPVGTGDAFVGGLLAGLLGGADLPGALEYAAAAAALKRTVPGDVAVLTPDEVERVVADEGEAISR